MITLITYGTLIRQKISLSLLLLVTTALLPLSQGFRVLKEVKEAQPILGVHFSPLRDPWFYSNFVPLIYELKLPNWTASDLTLKWPFNNTRPCPEEIHHTKPDNGNLTYRPPIICPLSHFVRDLSLHFLNSMTEWAMYSRKPDKNYHSSYSIEGELKPLQSIYSCREIRAHFNSYVISPEEGDEYLFNYLAKCPVGDILYEELETPWPETTAKVFSTMLRGFVRTYFPPKKYLVTGYTKFAVLSNAFTGAQAVKLIDFIYTSQKLSEGFKSCSDSKRIPLSLVSPDTLRASLQKIEDNLLLISIKDKDSYQLSIDKNDISTLYKLPLADCVVTEGSYLIRILIPVRPTRREYKMVLSNPVPYLRTSENSSEVCEYFGVTGSYIVEGSWIVKSDCSEGHLCLIPERGDMTSVPPCLVSVYKDFIAGTQTKVTTPSKGSRVGVKIGTGNTVADIDNQCSLKCIRVEQDKLPYIKQINSDLFVLMGTSSLSDTFVHCGGVPLKMLDPPEKAGALEVRLPCNCEILHKSESLKATKPCGLEFRLRRVQPHIPLHRDDVRTEDSGFNLPGPSVATNVVPLRSYPDNDAESSGVFMETLLSLGYFLAAVEMLAIMYAFYFSREMAKRIQRLEAAKAVIYNPIDQNNLDPYHDHHYDSFL